MQTAFQSFHFDLAYPEGIENNYWNRTRNAVIVHEIRKISRRSSILDVGCGRGLVVAYLRKKGIICCGVELAGLSVATDVKDFVHTGIKAEDLPLKERLTYDVLLVLDVIEHLPNEAEFLRSLTAAFPNAATIVITVPARKELWSNYDEFFGHYRRYDRKNLQEALRLEGWHMARISYFFRLLYLPILGLKMISKNRNVKMVPPSGVGKILHKILSAISLLEYYFLPDFVAGTSLVCTLVKETAPA